MLLNRTDDDLPWVIVCAGLSRSGSTWQFNVVRELLKQQRPQTDQYGAWIGDYDPSNRAALHIVKVHSPKDACALRPVAIVTGFRDLRAVVGSLVRMGWCTSELDEISSVLDTYIDNSAVWQSMAQVVTDYRQILGDPKECVREIALGLGMQCTPSQASQTLASIDRLYVERSMASVDALRYDPVTMLHIGHIGDITNDTAMERLDPRVINFIEMRYRGWLLDHGFEILTPNCTQGGGRTRTQQAKTSFAEDMPTAEPARQVCAQTFAPRCPAVAS